VESLIWAVTGLLLILAEFAVPQFVVFFFGLGALVNAILVPLVPGLSRNIPLQLILWAITSGVSLGMLRKYASRWFRGDTGGTNSDADVGRTATVLEEIAPDSPGRISLHGTSWRAITIDETIPAGSTVTILGKENLSYTVTAGDLLADSRTEKEYP